MVESPANAALRWAIAGTGFISNTMAEAIASSPGSVLQAVGGRRDAAVAEFASRYKPRWTSTDLDELATAVDIDAVYVATPNHAHHPVAIAAAKAGKAVLCEKSLTRTMRTAEELVAAVQSYETLLVEGLMYLAHPLYDVVLDRLASGALGELRAVSGWYHADIHTRANPAGGGTLYNLGCYPVSLLHLVVQTMCGPGAFADRELVAVGNRQVVDGHDIVVDAALSARFSNGVTATLQSSDTHGMDHGFAVATTEGVLRWKTNPWLPTGGDNVVEWQPHDAPIERLQVADGHDAFFHQVQLIERLVAAGATEAERPSPRLADSLEIMAMLTDWGAAV